MSKYINSFSTTNLYRIQPQASNSTNIESFEAQLVEVPNELSEHIPNDHSNTINSNRQAENACLNLHQRIESFSQPLSYENPFEVLQLECNEPSTQEENNPHTAPPHLISQEETQQKDFIEQQSITGIDPTFMAELSQDLEEEIRSQYPENPSLQPCRNVSSGSNPHRRTLTRDIHTVTDTKERAPPKETTLPPEFINAIPENLRGDLLTFNSRTNTQMPQNVSSQNQSQTASTERQGTQPLNNSTFVSQLCPELRQEVLQNADADFLTSLSPRLRASDHRINSNSYENTNRGSTQAQTGINLFRRDPATEGTNSMYGNVSNQSSQNMLGMTRASPEVTQMIESNNPFERNLRRKARICSIKVNKSKATASKRKIMRRKTFVPDEKMLESILSLLYNSEESFENYPLNLLKAFLSHSSTQYKILHCLVFVLTHPNLDKQVSSAASFPITSIHNGSSLEKNYDIIYQKVSLKTLFLLDYLTRTKAFSFFSLSRNSSLRFEDKPFQCLEKWPREDLPLLELIRLVKNPFIEKSASHIKLLLSVIYNITKHCKEFTKTQSPEIPSSQINNWNFNQYEEGIGNDNLPFRMGAEGLSSTFIERCNWNRRHANNRNNAFDLEYGRNYRGENPYNNREKKKTGNFLVIPSDNVSKPNAFVLDKGLVHTLCSSLWNRTIEDEVLKHLSSIISTFCRDQNNFALFLAELKRAICLRSEQMNTHLSMQTSMLSSVLPRFSRLNTQEMSQEFPPSQMSQNYQGIDKDNLLENLLESFGLEMEDSAQLYKVLKVMKELFEQCIIETSRKNKKMEDVLRDLLILKRAKSVDELSREEVKLKFKDVLETNVLRSLWINTTEFLGSLSQAYMNNWAAICPLTQRLQPVLECFFLVYKLLYDEEAYKYYQKGKFITTKGLKRIENISISKVTQEDETEEEDIFDYDNNYQGSQSIRDLDREKMRTILSQGFEGQELNPEELLRWVCEKSKGVINVMVRQNPTSLAGPIGIVMRKFPRYLDFDNKKAYFKSELKRLKKGSYRSVKLRVNRSSLFMDSFAQIMARKPQDLQGKLSVEFIDEEAVDAGGVSREWFLELSREILNPNYVLFKPAANKSTYQPSPQSCVNTDHLKYFKFVGRVIGKALQDGHMMDCYFTRSFYKHILGTFSIISRVMEFLGQPLTCKDMEDIDPDYYRNLKWILDNDISGLDLTFW